VVEFLSAACKSRYYRRSPDLEHNEKRRELTGSCARAPLCLENTVGRGPGSREKGKGHTQGGKGAPNSRPHPATRRFERRNLGSKNGNQRNSKSRRLAPENSNPTDFCA
jgi:hypothetical protein